MVHENMSKPVVLVFAGPNGSGKSTIAGLIPHCGVYINADDLKREYSLTDIEAAKEAEALRNKLVKKKPILHLRQFYQRSVICFC